MSFGYRLGIVWVSFGYPVTKSVVLARPGIVWVSSENFLPDVCGVSFGYHIATNLGFPKSTAYGNWKILRRGGHERRAGPGPR